MAGLLASLTIGGCSPDADSAVSTKKPKRAKVHLVELAQVRLDDLQGTSVYTGSLRYRRKHRLFTQEDGRITALDVYEGDEVAPGQVLITLDDTLLKAELAKASALRRETELNLKRLRRLRAKKAIADEEYLRGTTAVEVARAEEQVLSTRLSYMRVESPVGAVVAARLAEPGDFVERNTHVLTLIEPKSLMSEIAISEMVLPHIQVGDDVSIRIDALGPARHRGRVQRVHPEIDPRTRQGIVEVVLVPIPNGAKAGQFARVSLTTTSMARFIAPFSAIRRDRDGEFVFRLTSNSSVERVAVRSGRRIADRVEVLEGLDAGDHVVVRGFLGLTPGKTVKIVTPAPTSN
ncbi:MAG: efflux RND transporter periplasmic adaptor subunit [Pseudomonadota bacterium]